MNRRRHPSGWPGNARDARGHEILSTLDELIDAHPSHLASNGRDGSPTCPKTRTNKRIVAVRIGVSCPYGATRCGPVGNPRNHVPSHAKDATSPQSGPAR
jgi:hypothetical protein